MTIKWEHLNFINRYKAQGRKGVYAIDRDMGHIGHKRGYSVSVSVPSQLNPVRLGYFSGLAAAKAAARDYDRQEG